MMRFALILAVLAAATPAYADMPADARAFYEQGSKDLEAGRFEQACKAFEAALSRYSDNGIKAALADCSEARGKLATAWNLWVAVRDSVKDEELKAEATKRAAELEPRLPKFIIKLAESVPGLTVTVNGQRVPDATLTIPIAVDPGPLTVVATASGYRDYASNTQAAAEKRTTTIEIPKLIELPKPIESKPTLMPGGSTQVVVVREDNAATRRSRHVIGGSMMGIGVVALGVGALFGKQAFSKWDDVVKLCGGKDMLDNCAQNGQAQEISKQAENTALTSTILMSAGGALVLVGGVIWLTAPKVESKPATALRVVPSVSPSAIGVTLSGGWR